MSSVSATEIPITRMRAEDRRELILAAATAVFGDYGYVGTTTDQVARAAEVSQPYVVRMFGTKEKLFVAVLERDLELMMRGFRAALADENGMPVQRRLGLAYVGLLSERGVLLSLMHAFVLGSDPVIGEVARAGFLKVYKFLREEVGLSPEEAQQFLASGMLANTMIGLRMTDEYNSGPQVQELLMACFPEKLDIVIKLGDTYKPGPK